MMKKKRTGLIYIIENTVNEKKYVGQTVSSHKKRFTDHKKRLKEKYISKMTKLEKAIYTLGEEKFTVRVLERNIPIDMLDAKEKEYIKKYDSYYSGYNSTSGGAGFYYDRVNLERIVYSDELISSVIEDLVKGESFKSISKKHNIELGVISDINTGRMRYNLIPGVTYPIQSLSNKKNFTKEELKEIHYLILEGKTTLEISECYDTSPATISKISNGISMCNRLEGFTYPLRYGYSSNGSLDRSDLSIVVSMLHMGVHIKHIAELLSLSYGQVRDINLGRSYSHILSEIGVSEFPIQSKKLSVKSSKYQIKVYGVL